MAAKVVIKASKNAYFFINTLSYWHIRTKLDIKKLALDSVNLDPKMYVKVKILYK